MAQDEDVLSFSDGEIYFWREPGTAIHIKAVTSFGDPVELNASQAKEVAQALLRLAQQLDEE